MQLVLPHPALHGGPTPELGELYAHSTDASNGVLGTGDKPFRVGHSPATSPCYLEHSTPTRRGNVAGAIGGIADVILET